MELLLSGLSRPDFAPETWAALKYAVGRREEQEYLRLMVVVSAIISAGRLAASGEPGEHLSTALKDYKNAAFPELAEELLEKSRKTEKLLQEEFKKGPMKVQALNYDKKKKKRR